MDKIKDLLYDLSDLFVSAIIVVLIFGVVTWKISDVMKVPGVSIAESDNNYISVIDDTNDENKIEVITVEPSDEANTDGETETGESTESGGAEVDNGTSSNSSNNGESEASTDAKPVPSNKVFTIKIDIPSGTTGFGISKILKSNGLIDDTNEFLKLATEIELVNKMRSGEYELSSNMSMEEIIRKLSGK